MKYHILGSLIALATSFVISMPESLAQTGLSIETMQPTRFTVAPYASSPISMKTIPQATCVLHAEGAVNTGPSLTLFADDEGMVRFHVRPTAEADQAEHVEVDCVADGKITRFPLHLRPNSSPTPDMPVPAAEVKKSRPGAYVRPALSEGDALQLTREELERQGYPPRPDLEQAPGAFAKWLEVVTHSMTFVPSRSIPDPEVRHRQPPSTGMSMIDCTGANLEDQPCVYSGYQLSTGCAISDCGFGYDTAYAYWTVPAIQTFESNTNTASSLWVGIQGSAGLWQAGTDHDQVDIVSCFLFFCSHSEYARYYAWTDFPNGANETPSQVIPNFTVNPGDLIYTYLWMSGGNVLADVYNATRNEYTRTTVPAPATFHYGSQALFIMERPSHCSGADLSTCVPYDLADYGDAYMYEPYAHLSNGYWQLYSAEVTGFDPAEEGWAIYALSNSMNMWSGGNTGNLLSAVYSFVPPWAQGVSTVGMWFHWYNFH